MKETGAEEPTSSTPPAVPLDMSALRRRMDSVQEADALRARLDRWLAVVKLYSSERVFDATLMTYSVFSFSLLVLLMSLTSTSSLCISTMA